MNKVTFTHFCDYASFGENKKLNMFGVFDWVYTENHVANRPLSSLVIGLELKKGNHSLELTNKDDELLYKNTLEAPENNYPFKHIINFVNYPFKGPGDIIFNIKIDGEKIGETSLTTKENIKNE